MQSLILTLHIIVCVLLVILILLQSGKEGMGVIFGGGNSSVFGSTGAGGVLAKLTALMAVIFVITSLSYTYVSSSRPKSESVILDVQIEDQGNQSKQPDADKNSESTDQGQQTPPPKAEEPASSQSNPPQSAGETPPAPENSPAPVPANEGDSAAPKQ